MLSPSRCWPPVLFKVFNQSLLTLKIPYVQIAPNQTLHLLEALNYTHAECEANNNQQPRAES